MIKYLIDDDGNTTHAVVPIDEWDNIIDELNDFRNEEKDKDYIKPEVTSSLGQMAMLHQIYSKYPNFDAMRDILDDEYKYFSSFSSNDIGLLYLVRSPEFCNFLNMHNKVELDEISKKYSDFFIYKKDGSQITADDVRDFLHTMMAATQFDHLIRWFNARFQFGEKISKNKIRRDADFRRLFIYDCMVLFSKAYDKKIRNPLSEAPGTEGLIAGNNMKIFLSQLLFKTESTLQVHRLLKEAKERIEQFGWKKYVA